MHVYQEKIVAFKLFTGFNQNLSFSLKSYEIAEVITDLYELLNSFTFFYNKINFFAKNILIISNFLFLLTNSTKIRFSSNLPLSSIPFRVKSPLSIK